MNKLSKEKRQQLLLVLIVTVMAVGGLYAGLIRAQQEKRRKLADKIQVAKVKFDQVKHAIKTADQIETELAESQKKLDKFQEGMASGDLYAWAITTIRTFKSTHKIEIPQFSQIDGPKDVTLLPEFPFKQASVTISGTAKFHDFGRFVADFENQFPHIRLLNLTLEPATKGQDEQETLLFRMEIATLVHPGTS